MAITLNGTTIKNPTNFQIQRYNLTKSGRLAGGNMTMDIIAKKVKFLFKYDVISGPDLDLIVDIIFGDDPWVTIGYVENNVSKTAVVYSGAIDQEKFRGKPNSLTDSVWYWKNFTFNLIQQ
jgi:hypothetical protein